MMIFILSWIDIEDHKENQLLSNFLVKVRCLLHQTGGDRKLKIVSDNKEIYNRGIALLYSEFLKLHEVIE